MNIYRSDKKSGGISNYPDLTNKPQVNGIELNGNKTSADLGIITKAVDDLVNYYTKQQTYTKEEINTIVENVVSTRFEVVNSLPTTDIKTNVIYLVPSQNPSTAHAKDEWINLDGTTAGWEQIGSTNIDLSNYVTTSQLNSTLTNYVTTTALNTALASYITSTDLATALASYITSSDLTTALSSYVSSSDLATALADYTTTSDLNDLLAEKQDAFQLPSMPTPTQDWATGTPFEYTGTTTNDYVHGYFYECKLVNGSYTWVNVKVQDGDTIQVAVMPTASADYVGKILQFTGATTQDYKQGYFYRCVNNNGTYSWVNQPVQDGEAIQYSTMPTASSTWVNKVVQFIGTTDNFYTNGYFYKCVDDNGTYRWVNVPTQDSETIQVTTMPTASVDNWKSIVQYIGATTSTYTNGYFYECVSDGQSTPTYSWVAKNVQKGGGGHTIEDSTGTALTQRDIMQFSDSFAVSDDSTDELTKVELNKLSANEMDDIVTPLPSVQARYHKYSTDEHIVGEWIDGSYIYEKTINFGTLPNATSKNVAHEITNLDRVIYCMCLSVDSNKNSVVIPKYDLGNPSWSIALNISATNITITTKEDYSPQSAIITIQYTKTNS